MTPPTRARRSTGGRSRLLAAGLLAALALVGTMARSDPARAQIVPPTTDATDVEACIDAEMDEGATEAAATRGCVEDPEAFERCMAAAAAAEAPVAEALDRCVAADADAATTDTEPSPTTAPETTAPAADAEATSGDDDSSSGVPVLAVLAIAAVAAGAGALAGWTLRSRPDPAAAAPPATTAAGPTPVATDGAAADRERAALVAALIDTADVVSSEAVRGTIAERLRAVGVTEVVVVPGEAFDPQRHRGVQAEPTTRTDQVGTVAATDRAGWSDRGSVLRPPEVIVYRQSDS